MAGIVEGPFRFIARVRTPGFSVRKMPPFVSPARRDFSIIGEVNGGPGPSPGGTYSYYDEVGEGQVAVLSAPVAAAHYSSQRLWWGASHSFLVSYFPTVQDGATIVGFRVSANGAQVGQLAQAPHSAGVIQVYLRADEVKATDSIEVEFYTIGQKLNPVVTTVWVRQGNVPPMDLASELAVVQAALAAVPSSIPILAGDGDYPVQYDLYQDVETSGDRPSGYYHRKTFAVRRVETSEAGMFWAVGSMTVSGNTANVTVGVCYDRAGGSLPFGTSETVLTSSAGTPATITQSTASATYGSVPIAITVANVAGSAVFRVELSNGEVHDIATVPMPSVASFDMSLRQFDPLYLQLEEGRSFEYSVGPEQGYPNTIYWTERPCLVVGTYGADLWP